MGSIVARLRLGPVSESFCLGLQAFCRLSEGSFRFRKGLRVQRLRLKSLGVLGGLRGCKDLGIEDSKVEAV